MCLFVPWQPLERRHPNACALLLAVVGDEATDGRLKPSRHLVGSSAMLKVDNRDSFGVVVGFIREA